MLRTLLLTAEIIGIAYILWCIFVFAFVSTLTEIKKTSWHFRLYKFDQNMEAPPKDTCTYRKVLICFPARTVFFGFVLCVFVLIWFITFVVHWTIMPFFFGKTPTDGFTKKYFRKFIEEGPETSVSKFTNLPPVLWVLMTVSSVGGMYYIMRLLSGNAKPLEYYITLGATGVVCLVLGIIYIFTRPSLKTMWQMLHDKICITIPVVD